MNELTVGVDLKRNVRRDDLISTNTRDAVNSVSVDSSDMSNVVVDASFDHIGRHVELRPHRRILVYVFNFDVDCLAAINTQHITISISTDAKSAHIIIHQM